jgi:hypothetical protein
MINFIMRKYTKCLAGVCSKFKFIIHIIYLLVFLETFLEIMRSCFYKNLTDNKTQTNNGTPNINEIKEFWSNIWSNEVQFNNQAEWIPHLENDIPDSNNRHMRNLWCLEKISILPLVISATGIVPQSLFKNLKILDLDNTLVVEIQKGILLYSCHIVRKFLNIDTEHNTQQSQNAEARRR